MRPPIDPPLSAAFAWLAQSVELRLAADGYPERLHHDRWVAHPMDGRYLLDDYLEQYAETPTESLRAAIDRVADAALRRMEPFQGGLAFWYGPDIAVRRANGRRTYSGLTQAYYARALATAAKKLGRADLSEAADRCMAAMLVPAERGGVLYRSCGGIAIAQVPSRPRDLVLNGWLSALVAADVYADLCAREEIHALVRESSAYLATLLPLFDVVELKNSLYALTGILRAELRFEPPMGSRIEAAAIEIPREGTFPLLLGEHGEWESHLWPEYVDGDAWPVAPKAGIARASLVLSRVSHPEPNTLKVAIEAVRPTTVTVRLHVGRYDPRRATQVDREWHELERRLVAPGRHELAIALPWSLVGLVAFPTNFGKLVGDRGVNSYHPTHVRRLRQLAERTGITALGTWADRWERYMAEWASMPMYAGRAVLIDGRIVDVADLAPFRP